MKRRLLPSNFLRALIPLPYLRTANRLLSCSAVSFCSFSISISGWSSPLCTRSPRLLCWMTEIPYDNHIIREYMFAIFFLRLLKTLLYKHLKPSKASGNLPSLFLFKKTGFLYAMDKPGGSKRPGERTGHSREGWVPRWTSGREPLDSQLCVRKQRKDLPDRHVPVQLMALCRIIMCFTKICFVYILIFSWHRKEKSLKEWCSWPYKMIPFCILSLKKT